MSLTVGNKNVVIGLIVLMVYLAMTFFIERTAALHGFHAKAAAVQLETKGSPNLLDHQITEVRKGPAYRVGGIYFTNYYPASYVPVPNFYRDSGYNMRLYAWLFGLFNIAIGVVVGLQTQAGRPLRAWTSWLAVIGVILYPLRDAVYFWGRWVNPDFSAGPPGPYLYPMMWLGGAAMFLALFCTLLVFIQGARKAAVK